MKIIFYVAGMPFDGKTIVAGKSLGGSETAGLYMAKEMAALGHRVVCFSHMPSGKMEMIDGVLYMPIGECTKETPFGAEFMRYAEHVPSDVIIAQRHPEIFSRRYATKMSYWWTHDLALKRYAGLVNKQLWAVDRILAVSGWHADQVTSVYAGINEAGSSEKLHRDFREAITVIPNGVDLSLFASRVDPLKKLASKRLVYSSRPERGLEYLVKEGGLMDMLHKLDPEIQLAVCGYDYTAPEIAGYYQSLYARCQQLPNVQLMGALCKQELARLMCGAWLHVYPSTFEETSCITAMEEQAAGTPFICCPVGALPETLPKEKAGVFFLPLKADGEVDLLAFASAITTLKDPELYGMMSARALAQATGYSWGQSAKVLETMIYDDFAKQGDDTKKVIRDMAAHSDVIPAIELAAGFGNDDIVYELKKEFRFVFDDAAAKAHYEAVGVWHQLKGNNHGLGDDSRHLAMSRLGPILDMLSSLPEKARVLDYGCCVGQITVALARLFKHLDFVGVESSASQVKIGADFCKENKIKNCEIVESTSPADLLDKGIKGFDVVICAETLEHIKDTAPFVMGLEKLTRQGGKLIFTTPHGPYEMDAPYGACLPGKAGRQAKEHLYNFDEMDLHNLFGHKPGYTCMYVPQGQTQAGIGLGSYCFWWTKDHEKKEIGRIDLARKLRLHKPRQTLSVCIISHKDSPTIRKTLGSVAKIADEILVGIDGPDGCTYEACSAFGAHAFQIPSPREIGFDEARNLVIEKAKEDWILWLDDDENLVWPERLVKYIRPNLYGAYAVPQHHFSAEPAGLMKTDLPSRLFRNHRGIKFFGVVHEHPEYGVNESPGNVHILDPREIAIWHDGYESEDVRQERFRRNFPLMVKDHEKYPERVLGQFLWIRDLTHLCVFEAQHTKQVSQIMLDRATEATEVWRGLVKSGKIRLAIDALEYVSHCAEILSGANAYTYETGLSLQRQGIGDPIGQHPPQLIRARFATAEDMQAFDNALMEEKLKVYSEKYL